MYYDPWDVEVASLIESFDLEEPALQMVREMAEDHGEAAVDDWVLIEGHESGHKVTIAHGQALLQRAQELSPT